MDLTKLVGRTHPALILGFEVIRAIPAGLEMTSTIVTEVQVTRRHALSAQVQMDCIEAEAHTAQSRHDAQVAVARTTVQMMAQTRHSEPAVQLRIADALVALAEKV